MELRKPGFSAVCFFAFFIALASITNMAYSQCEPDTIRCIDTGESGEICPPVLAAGVVGISYTQNVTIIAPESGTIGQSNINLYKIKLKSIENLPEGIEFNSAATDYYPAEVYCVSLTGTPVKAGTYKLKVSVIPFIRILGIPFALPTQIDSTSVTMTISNSTGIETYGNDSFSLINPYPNPFSNTTRIGFMDVSSGQAELKVISTLGQEVFREQITAVAGDNHFNFNGNKLATGHYFFSVRKENEVLKGMIIKK